MSGVAVKRLGLQPYAQTLALMQDFTRSRSRPSPSQIWIVEHPPVFTQGQAGKAEHIIDPAGIPVVQTDRGGQVTYHGPGQAVIYPMLDLHELKTGVRSLVSALEDAVISFLQQYAITAVARKDAPGVYVDNKKIASLGLRIRKGFSYHGLSVNINMDLSPFKYINPCGYKGLEVTQLSDLGTIMDVNTAGLEIIDRLAEQLNFRFSVHD